jgi:tetraacyldisaccharide 4'-kinase
MSGHEYARRILSGEETGVAARLARTGLAALEPAYRWYTRRRNRKYDRHPDAAERVGVPVVSIGNLTAGGTGKTPMVHWVAREYLSQGLKPAIVSRGYGAQPGEANDEWRELALYLPEVVHVQNPDRVAAAKEAVRTASASVIVVDDGFQHRRLHRELDIVLIDATSPFDNGHLFPRGLMREPPESLERAGAVIVTRIDQVDERTLSQTLARLGRYVDAGRIGQIRFVPGDLLDRGGSLVEQSVLRGKRIVAFCGIGNPSSFRRTLASAGMEAVDFVSFPDHHRYDTADALRLAAIAGARDADILVCTVKDLVKFRDVPDCPMPVYALTAHLQWIAGETMIRGLLRTAVEVYGKG